MPHWPPWSLGLFFVHATEDITVALPLFSLLEPHIMQTLTDPTSTTAITDVTLRALVATRFEEISCGEPFDPDIHGVFIVVDPGDTATDLENVSVCPILNNTITGHHFGEDGFEPLFEYLGEHASCFELVFVSGDGDFGIVIFIPKTEDIAPELLSFCATYAQPVEEAS